MATAIPDNTAAFTVAEVATLVGARTPQGVDLGIVVRGVTSDSRRAVAGKLFVALRGERFDGHDHAASAVAKGSPALIVERELGVDAAELVVPSTLRALGVLGGAVRRRHAPVLVAIAGSAGKTTTRALSEALLREVQGDRVFATPGNLNNRVGVPSVLLALRAEHRLAVIEIGTNQPGEVAELTEVAKPDVAVLTLIALEHAEGLSDLDGVEREEKAVLEGARVAIGNGDDPRVARAVADARAERRALYGTSDRVDYRVRSLESVRGESVLDYSTPHGEFRIRVPWLPETSALALMAALAASEAALESELPAEAVASALWSGSWQQPGRFQLIALTDGTLVVDDSYNSNPASLRAALRSTRRLARERGSAFHLVLGEMRELGSLSRAEHTAIGRELQELGAASLTAVSGDARYLVQPEQSDALVPGFVGESEAAVERVLALVRPGDLVLVKGSRGTRTDLVVSALVAARGGQPAS